MIQEWDGHPIVALYSSPRQGGFVQIVEVEDCLTDIVHYDAYGSNDLHYWHLIGGGSEHAFVRPYSLAELKEWLQVWDPLISEVVDLGDHELFYRTTTRGRYTISLDHDEFNGFKGSIKASQVPIDSILLSAAAHFFRYYKGKKAVRRRGEVTYLVE